MCVVGVSIISKAALHGFGRKILFPGNIFFNAVVARSDPICDIITRPKKKKKLFDRNMHKITLYIMHRSLLYNGAADRMIPGV
jgi:hypothetical protein